MMAVQWQTKPLGELCTIVNGGTPKSKVPEYWTGNVNWITPAEMGKMTTPYIDSTNRKITELGLQKSSAKLFPPHSVILSTRAPIGHLAINTSPMSTNQGCKTLVPNNELNHKYLYYFLYFNKVLLDSLGTGATFKELSGKNLKEVMIPVPPQEVQHRIVSILDMAMERFSISKSHIKMKQIFTTELFETTLDKWISKTEGEVGDTITTQKFPDVVFIQEGPGIRKYEYEENGYPMINVRCVQDGYINMKSAKAANVELANGKWKHFQVCEGDILYTISGTIGRTAIVNGDDLPLLMNTSVVRFRPLNSELDTKFLYYYVRSKLFLNQLTKFISGTAIMNVGPTHIKKLEISYPSIEVQKKLAHKLDLLRIETNLLNDAIELQMIAVNELKQSILKEAFTGKL